jgi:hypothetical protein
MKKIYFLLFLLLASCGIFAQGFSVNSFSADICLNAAGYFDVVEKYDIEFTEAKHGIFRDIVTKFDFKDESGKVSKRAIYISDIDIPGQPFKTNKIFGKQIGEQLRIKIGDKNKLVRGNQHYEIRYRVKNALIFTDDQVQLYWNLKPSEWLAVFAKINFSIHAPDGASLSPENCFIYSGNTGNTAPSMAFDNEFSANTFSGKSKEGFLSVPGQNVTVLVKLPKTFIQQVDFTPPFWQRHSWIGLLGLASLAVLAYIKLWLRWNKVVAVTSYYPPGGIDPAMAGVLIDNTANSRDITCLLPYWAAKGVIRMEAIEKGKRSVSGDLRLIKLGELPSDSAGYEYNFFQKIFTGKEEVLTSAVRGIYGEPIQLLAQESKQYYTNSNRKLKLIILALSWLWAFFCIIILPFVAKPYVDIDSGGFIAFIVCNFIFFFIFFPFLFAFASNRLRAKNDKGKSVMPELLGFHQFIKMAEVERIKLLLKEDHSYFEKTMPYAVAFNMLKEWTAKFEGLLMQGPGWYSGGVGSRFPMNTFAHSFQNSMNAARSSMVTSPSTGGSTSRSGGGSSGGGAGSGGGGSW